MISQRIAGTVLMLSALAATGVARGQVLADRVPSDAIMYVGWAGSDALGAAYEASNLKKFLEAFNVPQFVADRLKQDLARQGDPAAAQFARDLMAALAESPTALYVGPIDTAGDQPQPRIAFFARVGNQRAADLAARTTEAMKRNPNNDGKSEVIAVGDFLLLQTKNIDIKERLTGAAPPEGLSGQDAFRKTLTRLGPDAAKSALIGYADGQALVETLNQLGKKTPDPQNLFPAVMAGTGIGSLRQVIWAGNFDGANWSSSAFVGMRDRRTGLLALMDNPPLTDASLKLIPKSATEAGAFRFDGVRLLKDINDAAAIRDENTPKQIETIITEIYKFTGIDIKRDVFPSLGTEFVYYSSSEGAGNSIRGLTLFNRLRNPARGQTAIENSENFINLLILQRNPDSKVQFKTRPLPAPYDAVQAHEMALERITPTWAIVDGIFYFSMSEEGLIGALKQAKAGDSILDNPTFQQMRTRLGQTSFSSFDFVDIPKVAPEMYRILQRDLQTQNPAPDFKLPALTTIAPTLAPELTVSWSDPDGFHLKTSQPFPLSGYVRPSQYLWIRIAQEIRARRNPPPAPADLP